MQVAEGRRLPRLVAPQSLNDHVSSVSQAKNRAFSARADFGLALALLQRLLEILKVVDKLGGGTIEVEHEFEVGCEYADHLSRHAFTALIQIHSQDIAARWLTRNSTHLVKIIIPRAPNAGVFGLKAWS